MTDGRITLVGKCGTTTECEMLTVGSIRLVGATVGMTIERETLTVGGTMLVGTKDGNTNVALTDGATTERETLILEAQDWLVPETEPRSTKCSRPELKLKSRWAVVASVKAVQWQLRC